MDLPLAGAALDLSRRRRRWLLLAAAAGASGYVAYRVYHLPAVAERRRKLRRLIGDYIQLFVSTAVAVYLDKTLHINTYDEIFSGLTNPKHEDKVKDVLVSVCNGAVETLVKASHQVLTSAASSSSSSWTDREEDVEVEEEPLAKHIRRRSLDGGSPCKDGGSGWVDKVSTTLAVPSNRRLVLDLTGRVTSETVKSFLDFVLRKLFDNARRGADIVRGEVVDRGLEVVRYAAAKSMVVLTVCLALCLHLLSRARFVSLPR